MAITANGLQQLGFEPRVDFDLRNNNDGQGAFIERWMSAQPQPSVADIEAADAVWVANWNSQEYARNRMQAYASIGDQMDMQYWDSVNDTTTWKDHMASVKAQFPKG
tara:strand:+ start:203 stop:523 length:321 start_codon:yes stop_codon:yes gene_type:complete